MGKYKGSIIAFTVNISHTNHTYNICPTLSIVVPYSFLCLANGDMDASCRLTISTHHLYHHNGSIRISSFLRRSQI